MSAGSNIANSKKAYAAFQAGDVEGALENIDPDVEWIVAGNSTVSGVYRGVDEVVGWWVKLLEKGFTAVPMAFYGDDLQVVVLTESSAGDETAEAVDILEFHEGKLIRFHSVGDGARFERLWGIRPDPE